MADDTPIEEQIDSHDDRYLIIEDDDNQHRQVKKNPKYLDLPTTPADLDLV